MTATENPPELTPRMQARYALSELLRQLHDNRPETEEGLAALAVQIQAMREAAGMTGETGMYKRFAKLNFYDSDGNMRFYTPEMLEQALASKLPEVPVVSAAGQTTDAPPAVRPRAAMLPGDKPTATSATSVGTATGNNPAASTGNSAGNPTPTVIPSQTSNQETALRARNWIDKGIAMMAERGQVAAAVAAAGSFAGAAALGASVWDDLTMPKQPDRTAEQDPDALETTVSATPQRWVTLVKGAGAVALAAAGAVAADKAARAENSWINKSAAARNKATGYVPDRS